MNQRRWPYCSTPRVLNQAEFNDLHRAYKAGDDAAFDKLVMSNLRLVRSVARDFGNHDAGLSIDDLCQEGVRGLVRAVEKFDPERGYKFSTYARWWIKQDMLIAIRANNRDIYVPKNMAEEVSRIKRVSESLALQNGTEPTVAELADFLQLPESKVRMYLDIAENCVAKSLDAPLGDGAKNLLVSVIADRDAVDIDRVLIAEELRHFMKDLLMRVLNEREFDIINRRYNFGDHEGFESLNSIGRGYGLSRERVRQLERRALEKIKDALKARSSEW